MTDPTSAVEPAADDFDANGGDRDPLTTDDGLAEASEGIPAVEDRDGPSGNDGLYVQYDDGEPFDMFPRQPPVEARGLEVGDDGNDPLADADEEVA